MKTEGQRIKGLDSIRFICAVWVLLGHVGLPIPPILLGNSKTLGGLVPFIFNGPAAVIVFFLISGFCIHYPYKNASDIQLPSYYSRRLIRIGLPALIVVPISIYLKVDLAPPGYGVFWSIICEVVYYLLYPLLLVAARRIGWIKLIVAAYIIAYAAAFSNIGLLREGHGHYASLGLFAWVTGLPIWLMGCWLAENYGRFSVKRPPVMWMIRIGIVAIGFVLRYVKLRETSIFASNCLTLNIFAILALFWLASEIAYFLKYEPSKMLERLGKWSYSLYLIHPITAAMLAFFKLSFIVEHKYLVIISAFVFSYCFYLLAEYPSHLLAVNVSRKLKRKTVQPAIQV